MMMGYAWAFLGGWVFGFFLAKRIIQRKYDERIRRVEERADDLQRMLDDEHWPGARLPIQ